MAGEFTNPQQIPLVLTHSQIWVSMSRQKLGGEFTYQPKWDPKMVLSTTAKSSVARSHLQELEELEKLAPRVSEYFDLWEEKAKWGGGVGVGWGGWGLGAFGGVWGGLGGIGVRAAWRFGGVGRGRGGAGWFFCKRTSFGCSPRRREP